MRAAIGIKVRAARNSAHFTQEELAGRIGIHADSISLIERGRTLPSIATLIDIADALNVPTAAVLPEREVDMGSSSKRARLEAEIHALVRGLRETHLELARDQMAALKAHL